MLRNLTEVELQQVSGGESPYANDPTDPNAQNVNLLTDSLQGILSTTPLNVGEDQILANEQAAAYNEQLAMDASAISQGIGQAQGDPSPAGTSVGNDVGDPSGPSGDDSGEADA